ncbi:MAG: hypothetical protein OEZ43_15655 [Gammaproteobacteria bacterium]|nr:hypothetical protein [Gammaproteobacteria bacterium]
MTYKVWPYEVLVAAFPGVLPETVQEGTVQLFSGRLTVIKEDTEKSDAD